MTLAEGKTGMTLRVDRIDESALKPRLMAMGVIPGTMLTVLRTAPLGDPMAIRIRAYNLALRREDARTIAVAPIEGIA